MSSESKYCPYCGSLVEAGVQFCGNCGASLAGAPGTQKQPAATPPPQTYGTTQQYTQPASTTVVVQQQPKQDTSLGTIALVFGILGFCCMPLVFGLVAVICGHMAKSKGANGNATAGLVLGYINLALFGIGLILSFVLNWF